MARTNKGSQCPWLHKKVGSDRGGAIRPGKRKARGRDENSQGIRAGISRGAGVDNGRPADDDERWDPLGLRAPGLPVSTARSDSGETKERKEGGGPDGRAGGEDCRCWLLVAGSVAVSLDSVPKRLTID